MPRRADLEVDIRAVGAGRVLVGVVEALGRLAVLADAAVAQPRLDGLGVADHRPVGALHAVPVLARAFGEAAGRAPEPGERREVVIALALELERKVGI